MFILYALYYFVATLNIMAAVFEQNTRLTALDVLAILLVGWLLFPIVLIIGILLKMHKITLIKKNK